ncbi:MAG: hypothetical protein ACREQB_04895 [Candidatus Binataceae bacterium]
MASSVATGTIAAIAMSAMLGACAGAKLGAGAASDPRCDIDAASICAQAATGPVTIGGQQADRSMLEQSGPRTSAVTVPIEDDSGEVIANVSCQINFQRQSVVYASASGGPPLTDKSIEFLRAHGLCKN